MFAAPDRRGTTSQDRRLRVPFIGAGFERKGGDILLPVAARPDSRDDRLHLVSRSFEGVKTENVHVHESITSNSPEMPELYRRSDVVALSTRADSFSVSDIEAMAMWSPVAMTNVDGIDDIVPEGETGRHVPVGDADALADRLVRLRRDPDLRVWMGETDRRRAEMRFNGEKIAAELVDLMMQAAASRRARWMCSTGRAGGASSPWDSSGGGRSAQVSIPSEPYPRDWRS